MIIVEIFNINVFSVANEVCNWASTRLDHSISLPLGFFTFDSSFCILGT